MEGKNHKIAPWFIYAISKHNITTVSIHAVSQKQPFVLAMFYWVCIFYTHGDICIHCGYVLSDTQKDTLSELSILCLLFNHFKTLSSDSIPIHFCS